MLRFNCVLSKVNGKVYFLNISKILFQKSWQKGVTFTSFLKHFLNIFCEQSKISTCGILSFHVVLSRLFSVFSLDRQKLKKSKKKFLPACEDSRWGFRSAPTLRSSSSVESERFRKAGSGSRGPTRACWNRMFQTSGTF